MQLINSLLRSYFLLRKQRIENTRNNPVKNQEKWFDYLLKHGEKTLFCRNFDVNHKTPYSEFAARIPLQNYNSLSPYIEKIIQGERNVLWDTPIRWMAKSSGTTESKSKFIPVSRESLWINNYRCAQDSLAAYCMLFPKNRFFSGKSLALGGCFQEMSPDVKVGIGDISAILLDNMPQIGDFLKASNRKVLLHNDWNEKLPLLAQSTVNQDVTSLSGVPSWMLLVLKEVLRISGKEHIKEVWPNLELFFHGGVSFDPYVEEYRKMIPDNSVFYMNMYNASEGFFALQDQKESDEMLLLTDCGVFYEFIPMDEVGSANQTAVPLEDVKTGQNYAMVITTPAGLWRYIIGDTVEFSSTSPYRFKITGRIMHYINAFGEELIIDNADKALRWACEQTGALFTDYTAAPVFLEKDNAKACHEWIIEFSKEPEDLQCFTRILDDKLQSLNSDYETKRTGELILNIPKIHVAPQGTFVKWLESRGHLGGQHKVPRLQNDRKIIEQILPMVVDTSRI
ncbi:GH3 auxin-responsive promoter family protein [Bacteroidales bacterium OttesenSCG-928-B11]|nr:GH3 auxin-responsive promoter family protein [Bacteroidales bacterium OttesenSCG-928-E04]MDL2309428.1 GH3 auxin-responsive promoter family protein [Bacteroidales bacterium OttesenSCG-928-C03]MDL2312616.1 GH3 auxin-responsive promoter family protein [Bacteroidales bacterium OttesenSCG-928-B11]